LHINEKQKLILKVCYFIGGISIKLYDLATFKKLIKQGNINLLFLLIFYFLRSTCHHGCLRRIRYR